MELGSWPFVDTHQSCSCLRIVAFAQVILHFRGEELDEFDSYRLRYDRGSDPEDREFIANAVRAQDIDVETVDSATEAATKVQAVPAGAIVCGSLHQQRYQSSLVHFVRRHRNWLAGIPTAFVSVSMTAVLNDAHSRAELQQIAKAFCSETGWTPRFTLHVAGALRYTQYDFFKRLVMKLIAKYHGGDTDTLHDHEYTDWAALSRFVQDFLAGAQIRKAG